MSPEISIILEADVLRVTEGSIHTTVSPNLQSWNIAVSSGIWQGDVSPAGSKTAAWYQTDSMGTREAHYALPTVVGGVCGVKPIDGKTSQMAFWESDQLIVPLKQGNSCGGKGLTVEPLRPGHILRTQMRVKGDNKTVLTTYPEKGWGGSSEEPDEGNLHVRFCEGAHSNLGAITPERGAL
uniref:Uncharacterized protein n=1 Tax=Candidatus Methanogaster sp. ANME-2c ERB4 TaxID=2759911 RepID=A0A7G9YGA2_9EURY|nr:hypothetical protein LBHKAHFG_00017 [Methanosarcinales archaeon ANME-2c ERB4]